VGGDEGKERIRGENAGKNGVKTARDAADGIKGPSSRFTLRLYCTPFASGCDSSN
jgi:hypothetical protein